MTAPTPAEHSDRPKVPPSGDDYITDDTGENIVEVAIKEAKWAALDWDVEWTDVQDSAARHAAGVAAQLMGEKLTAVTAERDRYQEAMQRYQRMHAACALINERYQNALERIAEDGGGLDVFLPPETLQRIAREALGGTP